MSNFNVKLKTQKRFKVVSNVGGVQVPARFQDLIDFDDGNSGNGAPDTFVLMYNAATQKWTAVNPDDILSASATDQYQTTTSAKPGLPDAFLDDLDIEMDNRIDIDAGSF
jgi:hypothetical protein